MNSLDYKRLGNLNVVHGVSSVMISANREGDLQNFNTGLSFAISTEVLVIIHGPSKFPSESNFTFTISPRGYSAKVRTRYCKRSCKLRIKVDHLL